jgi:hypothetical protein
MLDENGQAQILMARRMAQMLARNKSKKRTVRKLPQTMFILPKSGLRRAYPGREALHQNKRLAYIMLLGTVMGAYLYDIDLDTLQSIVTTVSVETQRHMGGLLGRT